MTTPCEMGDPGAKILVLGEAPSTVEIKLGAPLVGPSGEVFDNCLHTAGISRRDLYILNVWPFRVWKNKLTNHFYRYDSPRDEHFMLWHNTKGFTEYGLREAQPTLERIRRATPNVILTLGQQAMSLLTGDRRPIMKWRGSIIEGVTGRKVIPTPHPAATIHGVYTWRYLIINDMRKAKRHSAFPDLGLPRRKIITEPTIKEAIYYMDLCRDARRFATDLEVVNHKVHCFCLCFDPSEAMVVPLVRDTFQEPYWSWDDEVILWRAYASLMADEQVMKVNQNIVGFDAPFLWLKNNIETRGPIGDTMIAQHIMYPDFPKGLDFICSIRTDEPYYKDEGKVYKAIKDIGRFWIYNGKDGCTALEAWIDLEKEMDREGYRPTYDMTVELLPALTFMQDKGFRVELGAMKDLLEGEDGINAQIALKEAELMALAGALNVNSPKQVAKYFYEAKNCHTYRNTQGGVTTDDKAMARIFRRYGLREAKLVQEIRSLKKLKGTYLEVALDPDGRARCQWNPRGTWTGRLSSSKQIHSGTGMNMQNPDPQFKKFLIAD